ncbi:MAG: S-layer protein domain-containing protein [Euryarchaeota archaeon]|nr:S-layer protein domain-containing protein [Euryarchaeota archaeon]
MDKRTIIVIALAAMVFSIPAGAEINETWGGGGGGGNGTCLPGWIETSTPVVTATAVPIPTPEPTIIVPAPEPIIVVPAPEPIIVVPAPEPTQVVEIRGEVVDAATQIAPFIWTGQNFAGLYYDVARDLMSDSLTSTVTVPDTIEAGDLVYTAYRVESCYKNPEIGEYFAIGWFGERYMAINGKPYVISPIIFEMDECDSKPLAAGDEWDLGDGYTLVVTWIDLDANDVRLALFKNDVEVTSSVIRPHETGDWFGDCMSISGFPGAYDVAIWNAPTTSTFVYQADVGAEADVPIFSVYVDAIFRGTDANIAQFKHAILIDDDPIKVIETGDGMMNAETVAPESVRLINSENIDLHRGDIDIAGDLWIRVADDRDGDGVNNYRYYPYIGRKCPTPEPEPTPTPTPTPHTIDGPVEIRGEVVNLTGTQDKDLVWNAYNFAGFWYDPDDDLEMENLAIMAGALNKLTDDRTIDEGALAYTTHPMFREYELHENENLTVESDNDGGDTGYWIEGWMADEYVAIDNNASKLCTPRVEFEDDDKKTLATGEEWDLGGGFALTANQIDLEGDKVWFTLKKDGKELDNEIVSTTSTQQDRVYTYTSDIGGEDDIPVFSCYVDAIFRGTDSNIVQVMYVFLIDNEVMEIKTSNTYGIMEVVTASKSEVHLINKEETLDLDMGSGERIMGNMHFRTADNDSAIRFCPMIEYTEPGIYEVRGTVVEPDAADLSSGADQVWDYSNFAGFWYGLDDDIATETLTINMSATSFPSDRVLDEGTVVYETHPAYQEYELHEDLGLTVESDHPDGDCGYFIEGFMADGYVAIDNNANKLCRLLVEFEDDDKKTLATGEECDLGGGFALTANQIDLEHDRVWFSLYKDGKELDNEVVLTSGTQQDRVYTYTSDIGGEDEIPVFSCYVDAVFRGIESNIVQVMYVFLIDDYVLTIGTGDEFGCMEVVTASSAEIILKNDETIDLDAGTTERIMGNIHFRTADDDVLRFYPFVERIIEEAPGDDTYLGEYNTNDNDGDGVPDLWDEEADTPRGYWVNSQGIGRMWGDMNGDGKLTSVDALVLAQAAARKIGL